MHARGKLGVRGGELAYYSKFGYKSWNKSFRERRDMLNDLIKFLFRSQITSLDSKMSISELFFGQNYIKYAFYRNSYSIMN